MKLPITIIIGFTQWYVCQTYLGKTLQQTFEIFYKYKLIKMNFIFKLYKYITLIIKCWINNELVASLFFSIKINVSVF